MNKDMLFELLLFLFMLKEDHLITGIDQKIEKLDEKLNNIINSKYEYDDEKLKDLI